MHKTPPRILVILIYLLVCAIACGDAEDDVLNNQNSGDSADNNDTHCSDEEIYDSEVQECVDGEADEASNNDPHTDEEEESDSNDDAPDSDDESSNDSDLPSQPPEPEPSACSIPDGVKIVDLDWVEGDRSTTPFDLRANDVVSFKTEPEPGNFRQFSTYFLYSNPAYRSVWVSECPGVVDDVAGPAGDPDADLRCSNDSRYETSIHLDTGTDHRSAPARCPLESDRPYYINVKAVEWPDMETTTCFSENSCYFTRSFRK